MLTPAVETVSHVKGFILRLRFVNGKEGEVDLADDLHGEIFEPLREVAYFKRAAVHPELRTVTWPNGADFAPEFLYERVKRSAPR